MTKAKNTKWKDGKAFIGGYVDPKLKDALRSYADKEYRGNMNLALEKLLQASARIKAEMQ